MRAEWISLPIIAGCVAMLSACAEMKQQNKMTQEAIEKDFEETVEKHVKQCDREEPKEDKDQTITAPSITVNVKICAYYTGDGFRPDDPRKPSPDDLNALVSGEVYLTALMTDTGAETQKLAIQTETVGKLKRSIYEVFDYDIYHGTPTSSLQITINVYDDDGWPSGKEEKVRNVQESMGKVLELYPPASIGIPFIQPILNFGKATVDFFDPDDLLIAGVRYVTREDVSAGDGKTETHWTLNDRIIKNDNGSIFLTIHPQKVPRQPTSPR
jgi:hypothetical protein